TLALSISPPSLHDALPILLDIIHRTASIKDRVVLTIHKIETKKREAKAAAPPASVTASSSASPASNASTAVTVNDKSIARDWHRSEERRVGKEWRSRRRAE